MNEAAASLKSIRPTDASPDDEQDDPGNSTVNSTVNFHAEWCSNATHASTTDPEARRYHKGNGHPARLAYLGHAVMENRNGLLMYITIGEDLPQTNEFQFSQRIRKRIDEIVGWMKTMGGL